MRSALLLLLALAPLSASAQGLLPPSDNLFAGFPFFSVSHDLTYQDGAAITTSSGTSTPFHMVGAYIIDFDLLDDITLYQRIDPGGLLALLMCDALNCKRGTEELNGNELGNGWSYVDGLLIPRYDAGGLWNVPAVGALGVGLHVSGAATGSDNQNITRGWLDLGIQAAHAFELPNERVTGLTTVSYVWGFGGESQSFSARAIKVMTDVSWRFSDIDTFIGSPTLIGRVFLDQRTDSGSTNHPGTLDATFFGFGFGIGFD